MKKSKEPCPKGCKGRIINARRGVYCLCIERRMPKPRKTSIRASNQGFFIREYSEGIKEWQTPPALSKAELFASLARYGVAEFAAEMIWARFYEHVPFKEVVKRGGWTSAGSASHFYRETLLKLRKAGFSFDK